MPEKKMLLNLRTIDADHLAVLAVLHPEVNSATGLIRFALWQSVQSADPVQVEAARETVRKARKALRRESKRVSA